jgi:hypothetical protein
MRGKEWAKYKGGNLVIKFSRQLEISWDGKLHNSLNVLFTQETKVRKNMNDC